MKYTEIIAIVVSYNGSKDLLNTVMALQDKVGEICIVDNNSNSETIEVLDFLEMNNNNISVVYLKQNYGIGYALNIGVSKGNKMGYNWLLTMDQDSIVSENMIEEFCNEINLKDNINCLVPKISVFNNDKSFNNLNNKENIVNYAITSGNLVKLSIFEVIGLYNEKLYIDCVDFDFSLRLRNAGFNINLVDSAKLFHQLGDEHNVPKLFSWFYTSHSPLRRYYMFRNWGYIIEKYFAKFPWFVMKATIIHFLLLLVIPFYDRKPQESLKFIYYGIRDYFKNQYGPLKL